MGSRTGAPTRPPGKLLSITNPQQLLPLAKVALETKALGDSKARNDASALFACLLPKWKERLRLRPRLGEQTNTSHL